MRTYAPKSNSKAVYKTVYTKGLQAFKKFSLPRKKIHFLGAAANLQETP